MPCLKVFVVASALLVLGSACSDTGNGRASQTQFTGTIPTTVVTTTTTVESSLTETTTTFPTTTTTVVWLLPESAESDLPASDNDTKVEAEADSNSLDDLTDNQFMIQSYLAGMMEIWLLNFQDKAVSASASETTANDYRIEDFVVYGTLGGMISDEEARIRFLRCAHTNILDRIGLDREDDIVDAYYAYQSQWNWSDEPSEYTQFMEQGTLLSSAERDRIIETGSECFNEWDTETLIAKQPEFECFSDLGTEQHATLAEQSFRFVVFPDYRNAVDLIANSRDVCADAMTDHVAVHGSRELDAQSVDWGGECLVSGFARLLVEEPELLYLDGSDDEIEGKLANIFEGCVEAQ